jgi:hypothetical protein
MLTVKNSKKRSPAFSDGKNKVGLEEDITANPRGTVTVSKYPFMQLPMMFDFR